MPDQPNNYFGLCLLRKNGSCQQIDCLNCLNVNADHYEIKTQFPTPESEEYVEIRQRNLNARILTLHFEEEDLVISHNQENAYVLFEHRTHL